MLLSFLEKKAQGAYRPLLFGYINIAPIYYLDELVFTLISLLKSNFIKANLVKKVLLSFLKALFTLLFH